MNRTKWTIGVGLMVLFFSMLARAQGTIPLPAPQTQTCDAQLETLRHSLWEVSMNESLFWRTHSKFDIVHFFEDRAENILKSPFLDVNETNCSSAHLKFLRTVEEDWQKDYEKDQSRYIIDGPKEY